MKRLALIVALTLLVGCDSPPEPSPPPRAEIEKPRSRLEQAVEAEQHASWGWNESEDGEGDTTERRIGIRQKVHEYVKAKYPNKTIKGISLLLGQGRGRRSVYIIGVDLSSDKGGKTLDLLARIYVTDDGEGYWKIEELTEKRAKLLLGEPPPPQSDEE
jgi:hypothetical protein